MIDKIKIKLLVLLTVIVIISVFSLTISWVLLSLWWLVTGDMGNRTTFLYLYLILTSIPLIPMTLSWLKIIKNKAR